MQQIQNITQTSSPSLTTTTPFLSDSRLTALWYLLLFLILGNLAVFLIHLLTMPEQLLAQFIYDDGFYYLVVAKNFYYYHLWTFDSGLTVTSGFQPLFAYCLVALYALFKPDSLQFIHIGLCFNALVILLPFILIAVIDVPKKWALIAASALIASSLNFAYDAITLVEWPLLVLFSSCYLAYLYHAYPKHLATFYNANQCKRSQHTGDNLNHATPISTAIDHAKVREYLTDSIPWKAVLLLAGIGCLGSVTRFDFGAMPFAFFCAAICLSILHRNYRYSILPFAGLIGAAIGALLVMLHGYLFTGHWLQASAAMKMLWTEVTGPSPYFYFAQLMSLLIGNFYRYAIPALHASVVLLLPVLFGFALTLFGFKAVIQYSDLQQLRKSSDQSDNANQNAQLVLNKNTDFNKNTLLIAGSLFAIIGYCFCYSFNTGALQPWYTGNIIVPMVIIITGIFSCIRSQRVCYVISLLLVACLVQNAHRLYYLKIIPWESQRLLYEAGNYLHQHPLPGKIGSWNAGLISYYEGQHIINVDGLMNDEIYPYAKADNFECYILHKHIDYLVDFTAMFTDYHKLRGGYTHNLQNWLIPIHTFQPATATVLNPLTHQPMRLLPVAIYQVDRQGLAQANQCN